MNFLAHALLAGPLPADRLGGVLGDTVKGPLRPLPAGIAPDLAAGLDLHRRIDSFADGHPAFLRSRRRVSPERRRYAGILVDLFYDHFLALHWDDYCPLPLASFAADVYRLLDAHSGVIPQPWAPMFAVMEAEDWLTSYRSPAVVAAALDRMAERRLRRPNGLGGAGAELIAGYRGFEDDFREFFPAALDFAASVRATRLSAAE